MSMVDMARSSDELNSTNVDIPKNIYPYGLCICLTQDELDKLDLDPNCEVGDMIHLNALAKVTSVSKRETEDGNDCRVELQIIYMAVEDEETEQVEAPRYRVRPGRLYQD